MNLFMVSLLHSSELSIPLPAPCCEDYCMIISALYVRYCGFPDFVALHYLVGYSGS